MTNESPFRKNRAFYIGVVLTVLEGILSGCSYLSVYIVLTALASGTITAGMVGAVTAGLAVIFLLRLVIYSTGYTQVQIGGAAVSKRLRLLLGDKLKKIPLARFTQGQVGQYVNTMTSDVGSYEKILAAFAAHEAEVLIGTQMIVKGHDFPDVTLVGVIAADLSLNMDDYHCGERTFQLLTQAVGRSGRGNKAGHAVIQTYQPEHYSIQAAAIQDYEKFYKEEMMYRMLLDYPPAAHMMTVFGACQDEELLKKAMYYIEVFIRRVSPKEELHMIGPASASVGKVKDVYRQVLHLKHTDIRFLTAVREKLEKYIEINSGFRKIYIQFDMN